MYKRQRLTITRNSDNAQVLNIPLNEYLLLLKSDHFDKMGDQAVSYTHLDVYKRQE